MFCSSSANLPPWLKSSLVYIIFQTPMQSFWLHFLPMCCKWTHLLSRMPLMLVIRHFCWGSSNILFTLGNRCKSCCATHTTYAECERDLSSQYSTQSWLFNFSVATGLRKGKFWIQIFSTAFKKLTLCHILCMGLVNTYVNEGVQSMVGSIMIVGVLTHCALLYSMYNSKAATD